MIIKRTDFSIKNLPTTILYIFAIVIGYLFMDLKSEFKENKRDNKEGYERTLKVIEKSDSTQTILYERIMQEKDKQTELLKERRELDKHEAEVNKKIENVANKLQKKLNNQ